MNFKENTFFLDMAAMTTGVVFTRATSVEVQISFSYNMFILEHNLYEYSSTLMFGGKI